MNIVSNDCGNDILTRIITILTSIITIMAMFILKVTTGTAMIQACTMISVLAIIEIMIMNSIVIIETPKMAMITTKVRL